MQDKSRTERARIFERAFYFALGAFMCGGDMRIGLRFVKSSVMFLFMWGGGIALMRMNERYGVAGIGLTVLAAWLAAALAVRLLPSIMPHLMR